MERRSHFGHPLGAGPETKTQRQVVHVKGGPKKPWLESEGMGRAEKEATTACANKQATMRAPGGQPTLSGGNTRGWYSRHSRLIPPAGGESWGYFFTSSHLPVSEGCFQGCSLSSSSISPGAPAKRVLLETFSWRCLLEQP